MIARSGPSSGRASADGGERQRRERDREHDDGTAAQRAVSDRRDPVPEPPEQRRDEQRDGGDEEQEGRERRHQQAEEAARSRPSRPAPSP